MSKLSEPKLFTPETLLSVSRMNDIAKLFKAYANAKIVRGSKDDAEVTESGLVLTIAEDQA